ncbi:MAG: DEAD/DEAH box helicase [Candidatus Xenobia bacterium]
MNDNKTVVTEDIERLFPFPLDNFQREAVQELLAGRNVIVCAPTGAGKTVVAEAAVHMAVARQRRVFYTTPLKALSNQKFYDLSHTLGEASVGLLTGDVSIRRDAPVVVMTTEVFRNMLYGTTLGDVHQNLRDVDFVVLDECHFMNDVERGTVWEESIIYAPRSLQLVALSATVANATDLRDWMTQTHGETTLISTDFRPVPLRHYYFGDKRLFRLITPKRLLNPMLRGKFRTPPGGHRDRKNIYPHVADIVSELSHHDLLPAIYFVFSRRGCEEAMRHCRGVLRLREKDRLADAIEDAINENPNLEQYPYLRYLYDGLAVHHAGLLPSWKRMIERLFAQGLIQVVFATETLAAGINMPARTTVISAITRRGGEGFRSLTASEFLQMSGRAGRRGMDDVGHVVTIHRAYETPEEAARLAVAEADPLVSQFTPNYGMVLNLLQRYTLDQAHELIDKSFGHFIAKRLALPSLDEMVALDAERKSLEQPLCPGERGDLNLYHDRFETVRTLRRQLQHIKGRGEEVEDAREQVRLRIKEELATAHAMPCQDCPMQSPCSKQQSRIRKAERRIKELSRQVKHVGAPYWSQFERLVDVLHSAGYLEENRPTAAGRMAASLRAENVLFLTEVARSGILERLEAEALAAVFSAIITDEDRESNTVRARLSDQADQALDEVARIAKRINRLQHHADVTIPVRINPIFSPLMEAWVAGADWDDIRRITFLDEGDVVRALRRTLDITRQLAHAPGMPPGVVQACVKLEPRIARDEVQEVMV